MGDEMSPCTKLLYGRRARKAVQMRTLASTIKLDLTPFHTERVARIDAEDFSVVVRKVREQMVELGEPVSGAFLDEGVLALKQYYVVALLDPKNQHAVSDAIDPFWHFHILDTKNYFTFGEEVFGQYIHHTPLDHGDAAEVARVRDLYNYTARIYGELFGYINPAFYPAELTDERLICFHNKVEAPEVNGRALFAVA